MPLLESSRLRGHVVFHCPSCATDRVGEVGAGNWTSWPHDVPMFGPHIECAACAAQTSTCGATWGPVGLSFIARWNDAVRSAAAGVVLAGEPTDETRSAAIEFVHDVTTIGYGRDELRHDLIDPRLWVRVRGDVLLLGEDLEDDTATRFLGGLADIASSAQNRAHADDFVGFCAELLEVSPR